MFEEKIARYQNHEMSLGLVQGSVYHWSNCYSPSSIGLIMTIVKCNHFNLLVFLGTKFGGCRHVSVAKSTYCTMTRARIQVLDSYKPSILVCGCL